MNLIFFKSLGQAGINNFLFPAGSLSPKISVIKRYVTGSEILIKGPDMMMLYVKIKSTSFNFRSKAEHMSENGRSK